jgi:hypothetical protein
MHMNPAARRRASFLAGIALIAGIACSDFLVAENPGAIEEPDVNNPAYVNLIAAWPIGAFQDAQDDVTYWTGQFADEIWNREVFAEEGEIDRRDMRVDMTYFGAFTYTPMQRARFAGEESGRRLRTLLGDSASRDLRVARAAAYAGMSYVYLGEMLCETPIDLSAPKTSAEIFADAIARFQEAIRVADSNKVFLATLPPSVTVTNLIAAADSVRYFATVGAARAALNRNDFTTVNALLTAVAVPAAFNFYAWYSNNTTAQHHRVYNRLQVGSSGTMLNEPFFLKTGDPRIPRVVSTTGTNGKPLSPSSYTSWNNTVAGAVLTPDLGHRIASGLEAQYIRHEADPTTQAAIDFINARRAAGLMGASTLTLASTDAEVRAELREQRSRDFYLDGHRLGDLRRYLEFYNINLFPQGAYPGSTSGAQYNSAVTCWPLPTAEINGNPNIP